MKLRLYFPALLSLALLLGAWSAPPLGDSPYLMALHLHGSLSEGSSNMDQHISQAMFHGYDGIWWTDHGGRQQSFLDHNYVPLDGHYRSIQHTEENLPSSAIMVNDASGIGSATFLAQGQSGGTHCLEIALDAQLLPNWQRMSFVYDAPNGWDHTSLLAEPHVYLDFNPVSRRNEAGIMVKLEFSAEADGLTSDGVPRILELQIGPGQLPDPKPGIPRVSLPVPNASGWGTLDLDIADLAAAHWGVAPDLAFTSFSIHFFARNDGRVKAQLDEFRLEMKGFSGADIFRAQRDLLESRYAALPLVQHVGMEVGGPMEQESLQYSTRDHLIALFETFPDELEAFRDGTQASLDYPKSGVSWIEEQGGVAILAHIFGASGERENADFEYPGQIVERLIEHGVWGATGMEVGYPSRGRPLSDHILAWDLVSEAGYFVTGVGSTDNHSVLPWNLKINRWATWVKSETTQPASQIKAIRQGQVFFGDPHYFATDGNLLMEERSGAYRMGNVVPTAGGVEQIKIAVEGAHDGDTLVFLRNGRIQKEWTFTESSMVVHKQQMVQPGDWVRVEVRNSDGGIYLLSNPIYYIETGKTPPPHRAP